ncbi:MAG: type II toxin-antitoxin system RelE/ParE family toxin [Verrucomicrobia bacterium]|nr:type II toxin-antitoxin system RelE/ParE family toxin [Verrucomicrobiota bacterium]
MNQVGFHPEARQEFWESIRYYEAQQAGLARHFVHSVRAAVNRINQFPELATEIDPGVRQYRIQRFPYGLIYRSRADHLQVIAVMHLHRKPGYWRERLK